MAFTSTDMIISNLIHDAEFNVQVLPYLKKEYMVGSKPHEYLYDKIKKYCYDHQVPPTIDAIEVIMSTDLKILQDDEFEKEVHGLLEKITNHICAEDSLEFRIQRAQEHCQFIAAEEGAEFCSDIIDSINQGEDKYSHEDLVKTMQDVCDIDFNPDSGELLDEGLEEFWDWLHDNSEYIPTTIQLLDEALGGGLYKGELTVIAGPMNAGKTLVTCDLAARFMKQSRNVLYVSKENIKNKIKQRIYSNLLHMGQSTMKSIIENPKMKFVERAKKILKSYGKLVVKYDNTNTFSASDVKKVIQTNEKRIGIKFDIVIVDNLYNLASDQGYVNRLDTHQKLPKICEEIRNIAQVTNTHIVSPHQIALVKGGDPLHPDEKDLALAKSISWVVDNLIMIGVDEHYRKNRWLMINLAKDRSTGSKGLNFVIGVDVQHQCTFELEKQPETASPDLSEKEEPQRTTRTRKSKEEPSRGSKRTRKVSRKKIELI